MALGCPQEREGDNLKAFNFLLKFGQNILQEKIEYFVNKCSKKFICIYKNILLMESWYDRY